MNKINIQNYPQFGKKIDDFMIDCQKTKNLIDAIRQNQKPEIDDFLKTVEHTRVCSSCADYFLKKEI